MTTHFHPTRRKRFNRDRRERMIVDEAIRFFADVGFGGRTRDLAKRLGVSQPLIFRYFATKDQLIERVYQEMYAQRWKPEWETLLRDRSRGLRERLIAFYCDYLDTILTREWVRIFMYAGLEDSGFNQRYLRLVRDGVLVPICIELRAHCGLPEVAANELDASEIETAWRLHGGFFYIGVRRWIYGLATPDDIERTVAEGIDQFLDGVHGLEARTPLPPPIG